MKGVYVRPAVHKTLMSFECINWKRKYRCIVPASFGLLGTN